MVTDPIADFLIRLKNAGAVGHTEVSIPYSKLKLAIADTLKKEGYISEVAKKGKKVAKSLEVTLMSADGVPKIKGVERISKPSKRVYLSVKSIAPVRYGYGMLVLSTPKGILTGAQARKEQVGGEALFKIW
jgi:small subunit ribosomal protein S8